MLKAAKNKLHKTLKWSESYTKTDMIYAAKGGFWLTFGQGISALSSLLLAIAFANILSKEEYGIYRYILSLSAIIGYFTLSGLAPSLTRSVARGKEGSFLDSFFVSIRFGSIIALISVALSAYYFANGNNTLAIGILIAGALSPFIDAGELYSSFLNGRKEFKTASLFYSLRGVFTSLAIFVTLLISQNPVVLIASYFVSHTTSVCVLFYLTYRIYKPNNLKDPDTLRLSKHVSLITLFAGVAEKIDNLLVFHYLGAAPLAIYNFALLLPNTIAGFIKQIGTLAVPKFANQNIDELKINIKNKGRTLLFATVPITVSYIFLSPFVFMILFPAYMDSVIYSQVFAVIILLNGVFPVAALDSQVAIKEKYILSIFSNTFKILAVFGGIYFYGIWGAIIARIVSKGMGLFLAYTLVRRM